MKSLLNVNSFNSFHSLHMLSAWVKHQIVDIDILMNVHYIYLFGQSGFCLIFILSKNKSFRYGPLLKMHPSSPPMKEFVPEIQK